MEAALALGAYDAPRAREHTTSDRVARAWTEGDGPERRPAVAVERTGASIYWLPGFCPDDLREMDRRLEAVAQRG